MANKDVHQFWGGVTGVGVGLHYAVNHPQDPDWKKLLMTIGTTVVGTTAGTTPDALEPSSRGPNHRSLFHSASALGGLSGGLRRVEGSDLPDEVKALVRAFCLGYLSHCVLDARTPKGLPLVY